MSVTWMRWPLVILYCQKSSVGAVRDEYNDVLWLTWQSTWWQVNAGTELNIETSTCFARTYSDPRYTGMHDWSFYNQSKHTWIPFIQFRTTIDNPLSSKVGADSGLNVPLASSVEPPTSDSGLNAGFAPSANLRLSFEASMLLYEGQQMLAVRQPP